MNNLLENLNKEQLEAVMHKEGPLLIIAGAGTGKTTVITQRIAYLIEQGTRSDEILALTFTEKAAGEMENRVNDLLPIGYLDLWISTFHSFGERILREHGLDIGLPSGFKLLNQFEQWALIKKNLDKFDLEYYKPLGNPTKFINSLVKHFSRLKDEDISPPDYLAYANELQQNLDVMLSGVKSRKSKVESQKSEKEMDELEIKRINELANAYHIYQQLLLDNNALDFGDLINYTLKLFRERPRILNKYKSQFKYILLDEFQDTNWAQYELVKMLSAPRNNLVVVGDDDQSVYKFRGASVSNILQFKKDFHEAREIVLVNNYRSSQNILDLAYDFIQLNNPNRLEFQMENRKPIKSKAESRKLSKKLKANIKGNGMIELISAANLSEEIKAVIEKIADMKIRDKEANWNDFAILVRANESAKEICNWLDQAELPYQFMASRGLYSKSVIMDVISYLNLLDDYHESISLYRILNIPVFKFTYQELVNFNYVAYKKTWSLFSVLQDANGKFGTETQKKIDFILNLISKHTSLVRQKSPTEVILAFLNDSEYLKYLTEEDKSAKENIAYLNQFMKRVKDFENANDDRSVKAFLNELNLEIDSGEEGTLVPDLDIGPETIKVMTVHAAKGLEFKYVFITNMVDKRFPTIERSDSIPIPEPLIKETLPEGDIHLEEERRLFYVAMTRAKKGLYFSWSPNYGGARDKKPSRFLVEAGLIKNNQIPLPIESREDLNGKFLPKKAQAPQIQNYAVPNYFSYTQIAAFSNCPHQYRFAHILKIPIRGKANFSFGKTMHATLQKIFAMNTERNASSQSNLFGEADNNQSSKKVKLHLDEMLELYEASWIDEWYGSKKEKENYRDMGKNIIKEFYSKYKNDWPNTVYLEKSFNKKINHDNDVYTIRGFIDRIDNNNGELKIVDYKTGKPKEKLTFEEKEQLLLYQLAARDLYREKVASVAFYYLENNSEIEFLGTEEELAKMEEKVISTIEAIKKGDFTPKPSPLCNYCDFNSICEFKKP